MQYTVQDILAVFSFQIPFVCVLIQSSLKVQFCDQNHCNYWEKLSTDVEWTILTPL